MRKKDSSFQNVESLIADGVYIKGDVKAEGSIRVDGFIEGKMEIKGDLIIGEKGQIKGEILAENLMLAGKIEGSVLCGKRCLINESGVMLGDVSCSILSIDEGGTLHGSSKMNRQNTAPETLEINKPAPKRDNAKFSKVLGKMTEPSE